MPNDTCPPHHEPEGTPRAGVRALALGALLLLLAACPPTSQTIRIVSQPEHARVSVGGIDMGTTPLGVRVRLGEELPAISVEKKGYERAELRLSKDIDPWFIARDVGMGALFFGLWCGVGAFIPDKVWWDSDMLAKAGGVAALITLAYISFELSTGSAFRVRPKEVHVTLRIKR